jgi:hypothetical protein
MPIRYPMSRGGGDFVYPTAAEVAAYEALGYAQVLPAYADTAVAPAWRAGGRYIVAHPDGRRFAVTYGAWVWWYQPLGFSLIGPEDIDPPYPPLAPTLATPEAGTLRFTPAAGRETPAGWVLTLTPVGGGEATAVVALRAPLVASVTSPEAGVLRVALGESHAPALGYTTLVVTAQNIATGGATALAAALTPIPPEMG